MNTGAPATGGDISYQQDPEMKAQFMEVIDLLKQQGMGDLQAQKAALDWYQKQHGQADEDRTRMMDWANSVLGTGSYAGKSFDPNNPAAFAGIAADVNGLGQDLEERKRMIDESSLDPATKMRLKAEAEGETYSKKAKTRQDQIGAARQYIAHDQDAARAVQQAPQTGGAGQAAGAANANLGMQLNADIAAGGQTLQRNQFNSELEYRKALDAYNQQRQASRDAVSDSQWDRDYQLRVDAAKRAAQGGKTNFLSTLGGLLGKLGGGGGGGGSTLGNMFSNSGSSTSASSSQLDPSKPGQQGDFLNEDGGYNPGNRNGDESYYNPSSPFSTPNGGTARPGDPWW
jgi:hypothetical protein